MNSQQFTTKLNNELGSDLTLRPYNRFDPADTIWWLVPSTDWPAFSYGKFFVNPVKNSDKFEVGLFIEKGHGSCILSVSGDTAGNRSQVMDSSWAWAEMSGENLLLFEKIINELQKSEADVMIRLEIEPYSTERSDPDATGMLDSTALRYKLLAGRMHRVDTEISMHDEEVKSFISTLPLDSTISDLIDSVNKFEQNEWYWMNLLFYVEVKKVDSTIINVLKELEPWVKA